VQTRCGSETADIATNRFNINSYLYEAGAGGFLKLAAA
jgi:hypothetical protein